MAGIEEEIVVVVMVLVVVKVLVMQSVAKYTGTISRLVYKALFVSIHPDVIHV